MTQKEKVSIERLDEKVNNILSILQGDDGLCHRMSKIERWIWLASGGSMAVFFIIDKYFIK